MKEYNHGIKLIDGDATADDSAKAPFLNSKTILSIGLRCYEDAVTALLEALILEPDNALYDWNVWKAFYGLGEVTNGLACYWKAI